MEMAKSNDLVFKNQEKKCWYDKENQLVYTVRSIPECAEELLDSIRSSQYGGDSENIFVACKEYEMRELSIDEDTFELLMDALEYNGCIKVLGGGYSYLNEMNFLCSFPDLDPPSDRDIEEGLSMFEKSYKN